jgi:hypothetical protein
MFISNLTPTSYSIWRSENNMHANCLRKYMFQKRWPRPLGLVNWWYLMLHSWMRHAIYWIVMKPQLPCMYLGLIGYIHCHIQFVRLFIFLWHLSCLELFTGHNLNVCPSKWCCPPNSPVNYLSCFLFSCLNDVGQLLNHSLAHCYRTDT